MGYCEMLSRRYMDCRVYLIFCDALFPPFDASEMLVGTLPPSPTRLNPPLPGIRGCR